MSIRLRFVAILAAITVAAILTPVLNARPQSSEADKTLLDAANRDRAAAGLPQLKWDKALADAAHQHCLRMAHANELSHQFSDEATLQARARDAGARFSVIAENVALGPSVPGLHTQWMNSAPHRANLLDPDLNAVGISVVQSGNVFFAVEDFAAAVEVLSLQEQEQRIVSQLSDVGLHNVTATDDARKSCASARGTTVQKTSTLVRYETADLSRLPDDITQKARSGKYQSASVGACDAPGSGSFARYRIAILLF
jgi:uncharacterized protein YkwD